MMFEMIREKLQGLGAEAWEMTETAQNRWEFYYIGHRLDQNRAVKVTGTEVKVYVKSEDGQFLGNAAQTISPTATEAEVDEILKKLVFQAGLVKNPYYTLTDVPVTVARKTDPVDVAAIARDCIEALAGVPETETQRINSYEIFVSEICRHTLNSNGVEYVCTYPSTELEVVVNAKKEGHEIELHRIYHSGTCDRERLAKDVARVMEFGADRLEAVPTPKLGRADVLFSTWDACRIYEYFADKMHADYVARKISDWEIGKPVAEDVKGDRVTVRVLPELPNSSMNMPVDREGSVVYERELIRDGVAAAYCGSRQFSQYLGLEKSSMVTNLEVEGGTLSEEEIRRGDYLEVVEFSDFQVDSMSGDIAGEIRLGYLHRGGEVTVVTGGSVSGSMNEAVKQMRFSKEREQYDDRLIPKVTLLAGLRITGAE